MKSYSLKVSIIIPVYNGSNYLQQAIESALNQTYKNFEIIVVNDGSQDKGRTETIAKRYGNKLRYYYKENGGVASALNYGIKKMKGEWFSWLSHDDLYLPNKLADQMTYLNKYSQAMFLYSRNIGCNAHGTIDPRTYTYKEPDLHTPMTRQLLYGNLIDGCTVLIHKSCFKKTGLFNERNRTAQDYELWLKMSAHYTFHFVPAIVKIGRRHPDMTTYAYLNNNKSDIPMTMKEVDSVLSIEDIYPDILKEDYSDEIKADCHRNLGNIFAARWGLIDLAKKHYELADELDNKQSLKKIRTSIFFLYEYIRHKARKQISYYVWRMWFIIAFRRA